MDIFIKLQAQKIKSLIVYPLYIEKKIAGFIGFDECRYQRTWQIGELELLETISGIIANAYERKNAQEALIDSETNFHRFFETMEDMLIISKPNGDILHCNQALRDKLGYSLAELREMTVLDLHPKDLREDAAIIFAKMLKGQADFCPLKVSGKNHQTYSVETRIQLGKWNKEDCLFSISKDISHEEENLKLFYNVFENNPLAMVLNSSDDGKIIKVNPAFLAATGYHKDDLIGKTPSDINLVVKSKAFYALRKALKTKEKTKDHELLIRCKDGRLLNGLFSIEKITSQGKKSYLSVIVDVTERTLLLNNLESQYQKLENVIEGANLGTWEWCIQTGQLTINERWAKMLGYSLVALQPVTINTWRKFVHPDDLEMADKLLQDHLDGRRDDYACEVRMKHQDGRWVWIQVSGKVIERDASGQPLTMFGTHADISTKKQAIEALRESERRFFLALDETKAGLWDVDLVNRTVFLSAMWKQILGYADHEIENSPYSWESFSHPDDLDLVRKAANDYRYGKSESFKVTSRMKHKDGHYRWILTRGGILRDKQGTPTRWIGTNIDMTKEHEQALELERFFSVNLDLLCITDMKGKAIKTNKAWEDLLGYSAAEMKEINILDFIHPDDRSSTLQAIKQLGSDKEVIHLVNRYLSANGDYRHIEWRSNSFGDLIYSSARDITRRIEYEREILEISNRDPLTNIYNRRCIYARTEEIIEEYKRTGKIFSICIIDIDHFKKINDTYGHRIGDSVLKTFTKIIGDNLRPYDLLGRYGGEEFILVLNHASKSQSFLIVERILKIIVEKPFICEDKPISLTFSAGISDCQEIEKEKLMIYDLVEIADKRMYYAKQTGRNKIIMNDPKGLDKSS